MEKSGALLLFFFILGMFCHPEAQAEGSRIEVSDYKLYLASGHRSKDWDELIESGFQSFGGDHFSTALIFLKRAYQKGCRDPLLLYRLGITHESSGKLDESIDYYREARNNFPKYYPHHPLREDIDLHLGRVLFRREKSEEAFPLLENALRKKGDDAMLLFMTAQILREKKEYGEAKRRFALVQKASPPASTLNDAVLKELMLVTFGLKQYDESLALAEEILKKNSSDPTANTYRQKIFVLKQKQKEKEIIEKIVK